MKRHEFAFKHEVCLKLKTEKYHWRNQLDALWPSVSKSQTSTPAPETAQLLGHLSRKARCFPQQTQNSCL